MKFNLCFKCFDLRHTNSPLFFRTRNYLLQVLIEMLELKDKTKPMKKLKKKPNQTNKQTLTKYQKSDKHPQNWLI